MAGTVHTDAYKALLRKLVKRRNEQGLSQAQLAQALGKPPSFVGKYELGERRLDVIEAWIICKNLNLSIVQLLSELEELVPASLNHRV